MSKGLVVFFVFLLVGVPQASAGEWQIVGPRALGMGGANVAVANDATASYWNPAAFGFFDHSGGGDYGNRSWSGDISAGIGVKVLGGLGEQIDKIGKIDFDSINDATIVANKVSDFISLLDTLKAFDDDMAVNIQANAGLRIQSGHFGIGGVSFADITARVIPDLVNIGSGNGSGASAFTISEFTDPTTWGCTDAECSAGGTADDIPGGLDGPQRAEIKAHLDGFGAAWTEDNKNNFIDALDNSFAVRGASATNEDLEQIKGISTLADTAATSGGSIANNTTKLLFNGLWIAEVPLTYGRALSEDFAIGGNIKYMKARVYDNVPVALLDEDSDDEVGDAFDDALDNYEEESNFGIDLGMLYRFGDNLRIGLVGRNLNNPKFGNFKEKAQVRAGFAYKPLSFITLAGDVDLTENETLLSANYKSQNLGGGLEIRLFKFLMLRAGIYKNIAENDIGAVYTAGLGINLWLLNIDVGASRSKKETDVDGQSYPEEVKGAFAISMLF